MLRLFTLGASALLLAACATATPYGPATTAGGFGFSDQRIESNRYRITFRGNSLTARETVEDSLLFRAAELTVENGFDYFIALENDTESESRTTTTGSPAFYGRYGYGYPFYRRGFGFPYYAYGFGWGSPYYDSYTREVTRYSAIAYVAMYSGEKPDDNPQAFDAREVMANLSPYVLGDPAAR